MSAGSLLSTRRSLGEICRVPEKIISVYSLEQHVWRDNNSAEARKTREPELQTLREFQIGPVRPFLNDILRNMAAPYHADRKGEPIGQGYWIQAEFGSGKSHLLCFLSALALGNAPAWEIVREKEQKAERGRRESLYRFWEEGLETKNKVGKGFFVIVKTLVGAGGSTVGLQDGGRRLLDYILDAAKEQIEYELGKNISLYPAELLADRFVKDDLRRYRDDLKRFLKDPQYFADDEMDDVDEFIAVIQSDRSPEYKRSCGNKLWRFYTEYLKVTPRVAADTEEVLRHLVETLMAEGYAGVLLVLDEVSLFMKNRAEDQRSDDEQTLVVLSNRLAKVHNLPIWTVCSAQQAIESKMGVRNIIADDRLKLVKLLEGDVDYYNIVLARVRDIVEPGAIPAYYLHYKRGFTWPSAIGETEFAHFFPFHKPALEVVRAVTYELTVLRSAIHFMHQTLKAQIKAGGNEIIRLWELFDETVQYEEDPSGVSSGLAAIRTKRDMDYRAYEEGKRQVDAVTRGMLKVHHDKAVKVVQTLFLYHIARTRQQGLSAEEIANSVLIADRDDADPEENIQHYETLATKLHTELQQIAQNFDEANLPRYRFDPVRSGIDPHKEFQKARDELEGNDLAAREAWEHLLALDEWRISTRQMIIDLSHGVKSPFAGIAPVSGKSVTTQAIDLLWNGRQVAGQIDMRSLNENAQLPSIDTDSTDKDFAVVVAIRPLAAETIERLLTVRHDPRVLLWTPAPRTVEEEDRLRDFVAYRKLVADWQGKDSDDAGTILEWVRNSLQTDMARIVKILEGCYGRGQINARNNMRMEFKFAGELSTILSPLVQRVLSAAYESRDIRFEPPLVFRKEEAVKVINGIVKTGGIAKDAKPNQDISAAQNFGPGLNIVRKPAGKQLDTSQNPYVQAILAFIEEKLPDGQTMQIDTLYKNFTGIGGPKDYGLSRRLVQIYLLCLVQQGKVRVGVAAKSGLLQRSIDYSSIAEIDFAAKVLDAITDVQKMIKPENWEVLRPYAEKLIGESIPIDGDDSVIARSRKSVRDLFAREREKAPRLVDTTASLFDALGVENPYGTELEAMTRLFAVDFTDGDDIALMLYALQDAFGYQAFADRAPQQLEVDDLALRMKQYAGMRDFIGYDAELRAAKAYTSVELPVDTALDPSRRIQQALVEKLADIKPYIDSDIKLRTELIAPTPGGTGAGTTFGDLVHEYTPAYAAMHDAVLGTVAESRLAIDRLAASDELGALAHLERLSALAPAATAGVTIALREIAATLFSCPEPSRSSIDSRLKAGPVHSCGLAFADAETIRDRAAQALAEAVCRVDEAVDRKLTVLLSPAIRDRLAQGAAEPVIGELLKCATVSELRAWLIPAVLRDPTIVDLIGRYLKQIVVKKVRLADFRPSVSTVERSGVSDLALEFQGFLEDQLKEISGGDDTVPILQVE